MEWKKKEPKWTRESWRGEKKRQAAKPTTGFQPTNADVDPPAGYRPPRTRCTARPRSSTPSTMEIVYATNNVHVHPCRLVAHAQQQELLQKLCFFACFFVFLAGTNLAGDAPDPPCFSSSAAAVNSRWGRELDPDAEVVIWQSVEPRLVVATTGDTRRPDIGGIGVRWYEDLRSTTSSKQKTRIILVQRLRDEGQSSGGDVMEDEQQ
uniref:Uncharacterized protein n=1 Tax=Oryza sativa TaxID=4530 RepID=Q94HL1_ORYSA|nr:hypothetical protein [Oryza sativa]